MQPELKPIPTNEGAYGRGSSTYTAGVAAPGAQKVLRNTYLLLALTMVPTVVGAYIGMATSGVIMGSPILATVIMLAAVIGLQFGIAANRNSGIGVALLLLMTGLLGWWLGPILANLFLPIPPLAPTTSTPVIVVFSLFLLYDLQRIIRGGESNYIMAATGVYMSLFNIFANLLHLLLALTGERE